MTKVVPILFDESGKPLEGCKSAYVAALGWLETELGKPTPLRPCDRQFVVIDTDGDSLTVLGVGIIRNVPDVMFHVSNERATIKLYQRLYEFLENAGITAAMVYVDPAQQAHWQSFLDAKDIQPAHRWLAQVGR